MDCLGFWIVRNLTSMISFVVVAVEQMQQQQQQQFLQQQQRQPGRLAVPFWTSTRLRATLGGL